MTMSTASCPSHRVPSHYPARRPCAAARRLRASHDDDSIQARTRASPSLPNLVGLFVLMSVCSRRGLNAQALHALIPDASLRLAASFFFVSLAAHSLDPRIRVRCLAKHVGEHLEHLEGLEPALQVQ